MTPDTPGAPTAMVRTWKSWMTGIGRPAVTSPAAGGVRRALARRLDCRAAPARRQPRWPPSPPHDQGVEAISRNPALRLRRASSPSAIVADPPPRPQTGPPPPGHFPALGPVAGGDGGTAKGENSRK